MLRSRVLIACSRSIIRLFRYAKIRVQICYLFFNFGLFFYFILRILLAKIVYNFFYSFYV